MLIGSGTAIEPGLTIAGDVRLPKPENPLLQLAITSTFTAEPIERTLCYLLEGLGFDVSIEFAGYNQVFQQLLDPTSLLGRNVGGANLVLVRFEDWARFRTGGDDAEAIRDGVQELTALLGSFALRCATPTVVCICPPSSVSIENPSRRALMEALETRLRDDLRGFGSIQVLEPEALKLYSVVTVHDARRDQIGHMPYTLDFYAALGTVLARRVHAIKSPAYKVIALDCDNTLWEGAVGEDSPAGIGFPPGKRFLQEFIVHRQAAGMLVCLISKNVERDVFEVFETRPEMILRREHLVSWRVNWQPKSRNLVELAEELNLGLDSFIFLDDSPIECAEVRAALPGVLTLEVPSDEAIEDFLGHVWAFDRLEVTEEDRKRTLMYRQNVERSRFEQESGSIEAFLAGLALQVDVAAPTPDELPRVAQLTQRTNQFNFTTRRRTEAEVSLIAASGLECLRVRVSDRFGDYGLVGVMIFGDTADTLSIDTMLLSCRVLGRGVEHAMLAHLGRLAVERGRAWVEARFVPTAKNQPAANYLEGVAAEFREPGGPEVRYRIPAEVAAGLSYRPGDAKAQLELARERKPMNPARAPGRNKSMSYQRLAAELRCIDTIVRALEAFERKSRPDLGTPLAEPRTEREKTLAELWKRLLNLDEVGIHDDFTLLGGTSLKAAHLFVEIEERFGTKLPMTTILEAPTIAQLAERIERGAPAGVRESRKVLRAGGPSPALFLVHDGDGETLLYRNLAVRLPDGVAVYGLEPLGTGRCPILHTRIVDMASHYSRLIREVQPVGPYFLGGMCAGGTIAFEVALQLEALGQPVGFVALLDSADPQAERRVGLASSRRWASFTQAIRNGEKISRASRVGRRVKTIGKKVKNLLVYEVRTRTRRLSDAMRFRMFRRMVDRGRPVPRYLENLSVRTVYSFAEKEYTPSGIPRCPVVLYRATEGDGADEPFVNRFGDPLLGWGRRVRSGPEVVDMAGGHSSMLQEPYVARMAEHMGALISRSAQTGMA